MILRAAPIMTERELLESQDIGPDLSRQPVDRRAANPTAADNDDLVRASHREVSPSEIVATHHDRLGFYPDPGHCLSKMEASPDTAE
jgi:hypothetical protein